MSGISVTIPIVRTSRLAASLLVALLVSFHAHADADEFEFFEKRIRPVLVEKCYQCHSATSEKLKGALRLDTREGMLQGGESGRPAIVPGQAGRSLLIEAIRQSDDLQMPPPKSGEKLSPEQIADFITWINAGAPDPRISHLSPRTSPLAPRTHWAFQAPLDPPVPKVKLRRWPRTPIDSFILAKLEEKGLHPSPPADKRTLLRRATYDLTGLPPTAEELDAFLHDTSPQAWERVVDRLLDSPHYGERWGRYWLDVARYSDTKGYVYDREEKRYVHAHVYRDWVVRALNEDLPYDQFLIQQIAADRLTATNSPDLAALGFLTLGRRFLGVTHDIIDDRIDVLMRGTMALTVGCARCHDHKFDPIPTKDYYSLYGIFNSSSEQTVELASNRERTRETEAFEKGLRERQDKLIRLFQRKREQLSDRLRAKAADYLVAVLDVAKLPSEEFYVIAGPDDLNPAIVRQWEAYLYRTREAFHPVFALWHAYAALPAKDFSARAAEVYAKFAAVEDPRRRVNPLVLQAFAETPPASMREVAERYGKVFAAVDKSWREVSRAAESNAPASAVPATSLDPNSEALRQILYGPNSPASVPNGAVVDVEWFFDEGGRVELSKAQMAIDQWILDSPGATPHALILADRPAPRNARVLLRGNPARKGEEVPRQFLEVLSPRDRKPFEHGSGRLELARAIASRDNPLTARVMVNRVWLHHFGAGLVRTPSDFGTRSEPPSHPELLDWLARRFMNSGWSLKQLHRLILLSSVYQQSSDDPGGRGTAAADPQNRLLSRMNRQRLDFEAMRDSLLAVSGELDPRVGGRPVELFTPPFATRRTLYGQIDRQFVAGVLRVFDFANPDLHIPQRSETTVPQQALFFMNSPFVIERARALARHADVAAPASGNATKANLLPLPARHERGEGWGEENSTKKRPPLPGPLLPGREERENPDGPGAASSRISTAAAADKISRLYRLVYQRAPTQGQLDAGLRFIASTPSESPAEPPRPILTAWQYGYGEYDEAARPILSFTPLPHYTGKAWQGGANWPDLKLGWVQLTAEGGHPGNDLQHAAIRRWVAPRDAVVDITGTIHHEPTEGDGITARIISSRDGLLGTWTLHTQKAEARTNAVTVRKGDTLDFAVDYRANLNSDQFKWAPVVRISGTDDKTADKDAPVEWNAKKEFTGPPAPPPAPLTAWEKYAQTLLLSNEFLFVD